MNSRFAARYRFLLLIPLLWSARALGQAPTLNLDQPADSATFENPAHDFPKVIVYVRKPDGTLEARVSDGGSKGETFVFRAGK